MNIRRRGRRATGEPTPAEWDWFTLWRGYHGSMPIRATRRPAGVVRIANDASEERAAALRRRASKP